MLKEGDLKAKEDFISHSGSGFSLKKSEKVIGALLVRRFEGPHY